MSLPEKYQQAPIALVEARKSAVKGEPIDSIAALVRSAGIGVTIPSESRPLKRDWTQYGKAQTNEKAAFRVLLYELLKTLPPDEPQSGSGCPRIPTRDILFAVIYKVYSGLSGRRFMDDLKSVRDRNFISRNISYNSLFLKLADESTTSILTELIEGVASLFSEIETKFAVDSTGFRIPKITQWCDEKHGWRKRHEWLKCHVMCGTRTHIITAVEVTLRNVGDPQRFDPLMESTHPAFRVDQVAADRAYSTIKILEYVDNLGAIPAIPFKKNANPFRHASNSAWYRMFHFFALNQGAWKDMVNLQAHAESTFSQIKRKFGEKIFSKSESAQINEVLCKVLCHNLCVLIYWIYEFGVSAEMFGTLTPDPLSQNLEAPIRPNCKYNAFYKARFSLDAPILGTDLIFGESVADTKPLPDAGAIEMESLVAVVERLITEQGISRELAWSIVEKSL